MFEEMMHRFQEETVRYLYLMQIMERPPDAIPPPRSGSRIDASARIPNASIAFASNRRSRRQRTSADARSQPRSTKWKRLSSARKKELEQARMAGAGDMQVQQVVRSGDKVGRNDPCPCGSGKKYKKCCGAGLDEFSRRFRAE